MGAAWLCSTGLVDGGSPGALPHHGVHRCPQDAEKQSMGWSSPQCCPVLLILSTVLREESGGDTRTPSSPSPSALLPEFAQLHKHFSANPHFRDTNPKHSQTLGLFFFFFPHHRILTRCDPQRGRPGPRGWERPAASLRESASVLRFPDKASGRDLGRGVWCYLFAEGWEQVVGGCFVSIAAQ